MSGGFDSNHTSNDDNTIVELADGTTSGESKPRAKVGPDYRLWTDQARNQAYEFILASKWLDLSNYTDVSVTAAGSTTTLVFTEKGAAIGDAVVSFTDSDTWSVALTRYIADDDGSKLQDDDSTYLNLD